MVVNALTSSRGFSISGSPLNEFAFEAGVLARPVESRGSEGFGVGAVYDYAPDGSQLEDALDSVFSRSISSIMKYD